MIVSSRQPDIVASEAFEWFLGNLLRLLDLLDLHIIKCQGNLVLTWQNPLSEFHSRVPLCKSLSYFIISLNSNFLWHGKKTTILASFPGLPYFFFPVQFVFNIIHGNGRAANNGGGLRTSITKLTSGEYQVIKSLRMERSSTLFANQNKTRSRSQAAQHAWLESPVLFH